MEIIRFHWLHRKVVRIILSYASNDDHTHVNTKYMYRTVLLSLRHFKFLPLLLDYVQPSKIDQWAR